jgi:hypothetical protein
MKNEKPTLEQYMSYSKSTQWKYRKQYPGEFPKPEYTKWGRVPTIEEYERACKQYKFFLRKKFPGVFPEARPWKKKVINNSPNKENS